MVPSRPGQKNNLFLSPHQQKAKSCPRSHLVYSTLVTQCVFVHLHTLATGGGGGGGGWERHKSIFTGLYSHGGTRTNSCSQPTVELLMQCTRAQGSKEKNTNNFKGMGTLLSVCLKLKRRSLWLFGLFVCGFIFCLSLGLFMDWSCEKETREWQLGRHNACHCFRSNVIWRHFVPT